IPRSDGRSCFTTTAWWCFKPSASSVRRSNAGRPIPDRTCRMRSSPLPGGGSGRSRPGLRLRYFRVGGNLAMDGLLPGPVMDRFELDAALLGDTSRRGEMLERVQRGPNHVVRVGGAEALGEDVAHAGALQDRAHRAAGNDAGPGRGGLQEHTPGAVVADDLVRDGCAGQRDLDQAAAGGFDRLAHRLTHFVRLAGGDHNATLPVAFALAVARVAPLPAPPPTPTPSSSTSPTSTASPTARTAAPPTTSTS